MVRVKRRYILLKIELHESKDQAAFIKELRDKVNNIYGDFGIACLQRGLSVKRFDPKDGYIILCLRKGIHQIVMSSVPLITHVDNTAFRSSILHLSGTMRSALRHLKLHYLMDIRASISTSQKRSNNN